MAYSMKQVLNDVDEFPPPPEYLVWQTGYVSQNTGQIRHMPTLAKARNHVYRQRENGRAFWQDWAIYRWIDGEWVLQYEGRANEPSETHPLFRMRLSKGKEPQISEKAIQKAIASLVGS